MPGLIEIRPEGQFRYCRARTDVLAEYIAELERRAGLMRQTRSKKELAEGNMDTLACLRYIDRIFYIPYNRYSDV